MAENIVQTDSYETGDYTLTFCGESIEFLSHVHTDGALRITMSPFTEDLFAANIQVIQMSYERSGYATGATLQAALDNAVAQWILATHDEITADVAAILAVDARITGA